MHRLISKQTKALQSKPEVPDAFHSDTGHTKSRQDAAVTAKGTGPHRVTGPESTAWLLSLTGTVCGDVSANNSERAFATTLSR